MTFSKEDHWQKIYKTKALKEVSWYQPVPKTSLNFIEGIKKESNSSIIDIGGGDSFLSDCLIEKGYNDITVLDISAAAISRAVKRHKNFSTKVNWIVSDILEFVPKKKYSIWHDRATFHFLQSKQEIEIYLEILSTALEKNGNLVMGVFAEDGPKKCCSLDVKRYSFEKFESILSKNFSILRTENILHYTPFKTTQSFNFIHAIKK
tara:strand:- start:107 stop:724 length:618 start_codon:yes stop_codon:yes gene_type:complete